MDPELLLSVTHKYPCAQASICPPDLDLWPLMVCYLSGALLDPAPLPALYGMPLDHSWLCSPPLPGCSSAAVYGSNSFQKPGKLQFTCQQTEDGLSTDFTLMTTNVYLLFSRMQRKSWKCHNISQTFAKQILVHPEKKPLYSLSLDTRPVFSEKQTDRRTQ